MQAPCTARNYASQSSVHLPTTRADLTCSGQEISQHGNGPMEEGRQRHNRRKAWGDGTPCRYHRSNRNKHPSVSVQRQDCLMSVHISGALAALYANVSYFPRAQITYWGLALDIKKTLYVRAFLRDPAFSLYDSTRSTHLRRTTGTSNSQTADYRVKCSASLPFLRHTMS